MEDKATTELTPQDSIRVLTPHAPVDPDAIRLLREHLPSPDAPGAGVAVSSGEVNS